jgi:hypothetical protein
MKTLKNIRSGFAVLMLIGYLASSVNAVGKEEMTLKTDKQQVKSWNLFADRLYQLHEALISQHEIRTESSHGGYAEQPDIYTETRYFDKHSNQLLSRIQRMNDNPKLIQLIEINIYDKNGKLVRDYMAAYLPFNRNAPSTSSAKVVLRESQ